MPVDAAAVTGDDTIDSFKKCAEQSVELLRIELARQPRVASEVGEQDGHLPPLACDLHRRRRSSLAAPVGSRELLDGLEQTLAVGDARNAKILQVLIGERGKKCSVDAVLF